MNSVSLTILLDADGVMRTEAHEYHSEALGADKTIGTITLGETAVARHGLQSSDPEAFDALAKAATEVAAKMRDIAAKREADALAKAVTP